MGYCRRKTKFGAEMDIRSFLERNRGRTYFWTFTEPGREPGESHWTKSQSEKRFKPFADLCRRRKLEYLFVWELQKRGSWHVHVLVNRWMDVMKIRPWMVKRGWGPIMRVERVTECFTDDKYRGHHIGPGRVVQYLIKYLTKCKTTEPRKKFFGGNAKQSTTRFKWVPEYSPYGYLFAKGRDAWEKAGTSAPSAERIREGWWQEGAEEPRGKLSRVDLFKHMPQIIALGVQVTKWLERDPFYVPL